MQPVAPVTMVRGPAAFAMSRIGREDRQPWQVRWPELKYSSTGTFFIDLIGSSLSARPGAIVMCYSLLRQLSLQLYLYNIYINRAQALTSSLRRYGGSPCRVVDFMRICCRCRE